MTNSGWLQTGFIHSPLYNAWCVLVTTDVPCHLWLRWTNFQPRRHPRTRVLRGLPVVGDVYYCFVGYYDIEQQQAGDTLVHSFCVPFSPEMSKIFYYLHGTINNVPAPSTSPINQIDTHPVQPILNYSFEAWDAPGWNPLDWNRFVICAWGGEARPDTIHVFDGQLSIRQRAVGPSRCVGHNQVIDATPYRNQKIGFSVWSYGYNGPFCFFQIDVNGTGGWMQRAQKRILIGNELLTVSGWIPSDATTITLAIHTGTGILAGPVYDWFDLVTMHCP